MEATVKRVILGIDPGTTVMGYAVIHVEGSMITMARMDVLKLQHLDDHFDKLSMIFKQVTSLVKEFAVTEMAIEAPFYGKNVQSMLKLGRAQGISIAAGLAQGLTVHEYSPRKIKQSITGKGSSSKQQVAQMLTRLIEFNTEPKYLDETDALGVAVCHYFQNRVKGNLSKPARKTSSWKSFLSENPGRVR